MLCGGTSFRVRVKVVVVRFRQIIVMNAEIHLSVRVMVRVRVS